MGTLMTFYATHAADLIDAWTTDDDNYFEQRFAAIPHADFALHLLYPDDLDALWQIMHAADLAVPPSFVVCAAEVWSNGSNEFIFRLMPQVVATLAQLRQQQVQAVASAWALTFSTNSDNPQPVITQATYQSLGDLHNIANVALQEHGEVFLLLMF